MSKSNHLSNQLSQALAQQATLNSQLQKQVSISETFKYLFNSYRELKNIVLNPLIVVTKPISAEELAHTDVLKEISKSKHSEGFDLALTKITDLDFQDTDGKTALMYAIINGFYYGVEKLLQKGADVNLIDKQGVNALIYCAQIPHIKYIKQIAEKTVDINHKAALFEGGTALHLVVSHTKEIMFSSELNNDFRDSTKTEDPKLIVCDDEKLILGSLGGPNMTNTDIMSGGVTLTGVGQNPNDYPIPQEKTLRITKFLTDRGADINAQNDKGLTPFFMACTHKFNYLASCFVSQFQLDFSIKDSNDQIALHYATLLEDTSILQLILNKGVDINSRNSGGGTPLYCAVHNNKKPMVEFLLNKGADVNIPNKDGIHLLHVAVGINSLELIKLLVKYSDVNVRCNNDDKATALWLASQNGKLDAVKVLADLRADLNIIRANTGDSPLYIAMREKQITVVEELLARGADINIVTINGCVALHLAVELGNINIVKNILEKGANINVRNNDGVTPLNNAASNNNKEMVEFLLNNGADSNIPDINGIYPWHGASFLGFLEVMQLLFFKTPDINLKTANVKQETALCLASMKGYIDIVKWLIDKGADVNIPNNDMYPLHLAVNVNSLELVKLLVKYGDINIRSSNDTKITALWLASQDGRLDIVKALADLGADLNIVRTDTGASPLYIATHQKRIAVVEELLARGADVNVSAKDGGYPLHLAVSNNSLELVKLLVKYGDINAKSTNEHKITALWLASQDGKLEIVKILADHGADLNITQATNDMSPLYVAMQKKQIAVVKELLARGAEINIPGKEGWYPWHGASSQGSLDVMQLLFLKNPDINLKTSDAGQYTALWLASQHGHVDVVKWLIDCGADLNIVRADTGYPPLYIAMHQKQIAVAEELLAKGAEVNIVATNGCVALHLAVQLGDINITRNILEKDTNINAKENRGGTPLFFAVGTNNKGMVEFLLNKGAEVNISAKDGWYPWHVASSQGFLDVMQLLSLKTPDINLKTADTEQYTALWLASQQGHFQIVKWLAGLKADVNITRQSDGTTALQTAIVNNHLPVIKVLVEECKADINKTNLDGASPLYYSLGYWHQAYKLAITKFLLEHNANVHAKTIFGDQPIHRASNLADVSAMKLLLDHGASINEVNNDGNTPLHFLVNAENTAEADKRLTAVKYLLEHSASATIKNKEGKSAIDLAKDNFPEALAWLEHPENLPPLSEFEATIIGLTDFTI